MASSAAATLNRQDRQEAEHLRREVERLRRENAVSLRANVRLRTLLTRMNKRYALLIDYVESLRDWMIRSGKSRHIRPGHQIENHQSTQRYAVETKGSNADDP